MKGSGNIGKKLIKKKIVFKIGRVWYQTVRGEVSDSYDMVI